MLVEAASAATYAVVSLLRIVTVYAISLAWYEFTGERFNLLKLIGLGVLVVGVALYRKLIAIPWVDFNTKSSLSTLGHVVLSAEALTFAHINVLDEVNASFPICSPLKPAAPKDQVLHHASSDLRTFLIDLKNRLQHKMHVITPRSLKVDMAEPKPSTVYDDVKLSGPMDPQSPLTHIRLQSQLEEAVREGKISQLGSHFDNTSFVLDASRHSVRLQTVPEGISPRSEQMRSTTKISNFPFCEEVSTVRTIVVPTEVYHTAQSYDATLRDTVISERDARHVHHL